MNAHHKRPEVELAQDLSPKLTYDMHLLHNKDWGWEAVKLPLQSQTQPSALPILPILASTLCSTVKDEVWGLYM
jgi:hypothetical protein